MEFEEDNNNKADSGMVIVRGVAWRGVAWRGGWWWQGSVWRCL